MKKVIAILFFQCCYFFNFSNIIYVNANLQNGNNNGSSWENAYSNLQLAIILSNYGDTIWVAQGTYFPTNSTNRNVSFTLKNGRKMFGGFVGTETSLSERNFDTYETILSGDIGIVGDSTDNSYSVMQCAFADSTTVLDGFVITKGNADNEDAVFSSHERNGGGLYFHNDNSDEEARPEIRNCNFKNNTAVYAGGGIYCRSSSSLKSIMAVNNCAFNENFSRNGGGIYIESSGQNHNHIIKGCSFINNYGDNGGGINYQYIVGNKNIKILNSIFKNNYAELNGGGIDLIELPPYASTLIDSCLFDNNFSSFTQEGTAISNFGLFGDTTAILMISNSTFINHLDGSSIIFSDFTGQFTIKGCHFRDNKILESFAVGIEIHNTHFSFINNLIESNNFTNSSEFLFVNASESEKEKNISIKNSTFYEDFNSVNSLIKIGGKIKGNVDNSIFSSLGESSENFTLFSGLSYNIHSKNSIFNFPDYLIGNINLLNNNQFDTNPQFIDPENGNFSLLPCSPARNAGSNNALDPQNFPFDLAGNPRILGEQIDIGAYESPEMTAEIDSISTNFCQNSGGQFQINLQNGCPPYSLNWSGGSFENDSTIILENDLTTGNYELEISDGSGEIEIVQLNLEAAPIIELAVTSNPLICPEGSGSSAMAIAEGGEGNLQYLWNNLDTTAEIQNLTIGDYSVTVTDELGCTKSATISVESEGFLPLSINVFPVSCHNSADGIATVEPINGTAPFNWIWADGQSTSTIENLTGGAYSVTVSDAVGCTDVLDFIINPPSALELEVSNINASCPNGNNGFAAIEVSGGNAPYFYNWNNGQTDSLATDLAVGEYFVTVTDVKNCLDSIAVLVTESPAIEAEISGPEVICFDGSGLLEVEVSGGTNPYFYEWENGSIDSFLLVTGGLYEVTVSDANNCDTILNFEVAHTTNFQLDTSIQHNTSLDFPNGMIDIHEVTGGNPDYEFLWNNGETTPIIEGLEAGNYFVTITDADSCQQVFVFNIDFLNGLYSFENLEIISQIIPNPSTKGMHSDLKLILENSEYLSLKIMDAMGKGLFSDKKHVGIGEYFWALPEEYEQGIYFLKLENDIGEWKILKWVVI